jgi:hypothetical protein
MSIHIGLEGFGWSSREEKPMLNDISAESVPEVDTSQTLVGDSLVEVSSPYVGGTRHLFMLPRDFVLPIVVVMFLSGLVFLVGSILFASPLVGAQTLNASSSTEYASVRSFGTVTATVTPNCEATWQRVSSPTTGPAQNTLQSIAVISANDIWAVGYRYDNNAVQLTLALHWDGTQWNYVPTPNGGTRANELQSIDAVSSSDIWAVGSYGNAPGAYYYTLIEHWDGVQWRMVLSPNPEYESRLYGVTAVSRNDAWAVGSMTSFVIQETLILHWNGISWSQISSPNLPDSSNFLKAITTVSANDIWAVGHTRISTFIIHWNGTQWSIVPSPNVPSTRNALTAVSAISANDVWAVGTKGVDFGLSPLIEHWDGTAWSIVNNPSMPPKPTILKAISANATNDVWAVGFQGLTGELGTLVLHWDGSQWNLAPSLNIGTHTNSLYGVATVSDEDVWAVGDYDNNNDGQHRTLVERYVSPCITTTPTAIPTTTRTSTATPTSCPMNFSDVQATDYFYVAVRYLYCTGVISGYADSTFRPYINTTRGQLCKIVVLAEGWTVDCPINGHFSDVLPSNPFYCFIETAYASNIISGYSDGTFRPYNNVTRAQLCKIIVLAEGLGIYPPPRPTFRDVPIDHPFYPFVETANMYGIVSGYSCEENCLEFRPGNNATRGQISKIVYQAVTQP